MNLLDGSDGIDKRRPNFSRVPKRSSPARSARSARSRIGTGLGCGWATDQQRPKHHSAIQKRDRFALQMTHWVSIVVVCKPHALGA